MKTTTVVAESAIMNSKALKFTSSATVDPVFSEINPENPEILNFSD